METEPPIVPAEARKEYERAELEALEAELREIENEAHRARDFAENPPTSWDELDLAAIIAEGLEPDPPSILRRTDGQALLYPGKTHSFVGEPESGKTWVALAATAEVLHDGGHVFYFDFEDGPKGVTRRLVVDLGVPAEVVVRQFHYVRPVVRVVAASIRRVGRGANPALVILDGVTECMALHGWDINSATDAALFLDEFPRKWDTSGAAVVMIDHVVKSGDSRGRWAIGSQHKLAGVNGASYVFTVEEPFGRGRTGSATISISKDREGAVREFAHDGKIAGTFVLAGREDGTVSWSVTPYDQGSALRTLGDRILEALGDGPLNKTDLWKTVRGKRNLVWETVGDLERSSLVKVTTGLHNAQIVELAGTTESSQ